MRSARAVPAERAGRVRERDEKRAEPHVVDDAEGGPLDDRRAIDARELVRLVEPAQCARAQHSQFDMAKLRIRIRMITNTNTNTNTKLRDAVKLRIRNGRFGRERDRGRSAAEVK